MKERKVNSKRSFKKRFVSTALASTIVFSSVTGYAIDISAATNASRYLSVKDVSGNTVSYGFANTSLIPYSKVIAPVTLSYPHTENYPEYYLFVNGVMSVNLNTIVDTVETTGVSKYGTTYIQRVGTITSNGYTFEVTSKVFPNEYGTIIYQMNVKNTSGSAVNVGGRMIVDTNFKVNGAANDAVPIYALGSNKGIYATASGYQFSFFTKGIEGLENGPTNFQAMGYSSRTTTFTSVTSTGQEATNPVKGSTLLTGVDSAMAFKWDQNSIAPNETKTMEWGLQTGTSTEAPVVTIPSSISVPLSQSSFDISGTWKDIDSAELDKLSYTLNGETKIILKDLANPVKNAVHNFTITVDKPSSITKAGKYDMEVFFVDSDGVGESKTVSITYVDDIAPVITSKNSLTYKIGSTKPTAAALLSGLTATAKDETTSTVTPTLSTTDYSALNMGVEGEYDIDIEAKDAAGNIGTKTITIYVDASEDKEVAKANLDVFANSIKQAIDGLKGLTQTEKNNAKLAVDEALSDGKIDIDSALSLAMIDNAVQNTETVLNQILITQTEYSNKVISDAKNEAKVNLQAKANEAKQIIDGLPGLSVLEKNTAKAAIDQELSDGKTAIDNASDTSEIATAYTSASDAIDAIVAAQSATSEQVMDDTKTSAKADAEASAEAAKDAIDALENLSDEEKAEAKQAIDDALVAVKDSIDAATTPTEVADAVDTGSAAIESEVANATLLDAKNEAKANLQAKANEAKQVIDSLPGLSVLEKNAAKAAIDQELSDGKTAIDNASDTGEIATAYTSASDAIDAIVAAQNATSEQVMDDTKTSVKADAETNAEAAKDAIDALENLSDEEKAEAKQAIDDALLAVKDSIDAATTPTEVADAVATGSAAIESEVASATLLDAKNEAKANLQAKANEAKQVIDSLPGLSVLEKNAAKAAIDQELSDGKTAIDNASDTGEIATAYTSASDAIDAIVATQSATSEQVMDDTKTSAKADAEASAEAAKDAIDALENLSDEEKAEAKQAIDDALAAVKDSIDAATTPTEVADAVDTGSAAIESEVANATLLDAKNEAKANLQAKANEAKQAIDGLAGLTQTEKDVAKAAIDQELSDGKTAIDNASDTSEIATAYTSASDAIDEVVAAQSATSEQVMDDIKTSAKADAEASAEAAKDAIDALENLSDEEKTEAKQAIDDALAAVKDSIDAATTPTEVADAVDTGSAAIESEVASATLLDAKNEAKANLQVKANEAKQTIDGLAGLTQTEKDVAKAAIDQELSDGKTAIDNASDTSEIATAYTSASDAIDAIVAAQSATSEQVMDDTKTSAKADAEASAEAAKDAIDALENLSDEEKTEAKQAIDDALVAVKDSIDAATTPTEVADAVATGSAAIESEVASATLLDAKNEAKANLQAKANEAKQTIDGLAGLTQTEKDVAKAAINQELSDGKTAIDNASDTGEIATAYTSASDAINAIVAAQSATSEQVMDDTKTSAKVDAEASAEAAKDAIDALENLSDEEKVEAKQAIDDALAAMKDSIDAATTPTEIASIENNGTSEIKEIVDESQLQDSKYAYQQNLEVKAETIKQAIDELDGLSDTEKEEAKQQIDQELLAGKLAIDQAINIGEVISASISSSSEMDTILNSYSTISRQVINDAKSSATTSLYDKAEAAKNEIKSLTYLTDEEKQTANQQVDDQLNFALYAVDNATTPVSIASATREGEKQIQSVVDAAELLNAQNQSKVDLEAKAKQIIAIVDGLTGISEEEKVNIMNAIANELSVGVNAVESQTKIAGVTNEYTKAEYALDSLLEVNTLLNEQIITDARDAAISKIKEEEKLAIQAIENLMNLNEVERAIAITDIQTNSQTAIDTISNLDTLLAIDLSVNQSKQEVRQTVVDNELQDQKNQTREALNLEAITIKQFIETLEGISLDEKTQAYTRIDGILQEALKAVVEATDIESVITIEVEAKGAMHQLMFEVVNTNDSAIETGKEIAIDELTKKAQEAKDAIDELAYLSDSEKEELKAKIDEDLEKAVASVQEANSPTKIGEAINTGFDNIEMDLRDANQQNDSNKEKYEKSMIAPDMATILMDEKFVTEQIAQNETKEVYVQEKEEPVIVSNQENTSTETVQEKTIKTTEKNTPTKQAIDLQGLYATLALSVLGGVLFLVTKKRKK